MTCPDCGADTAPGGEPCCARAAVRGALAEPVRFILEAICTRGLQQRTYWTIAVTDSALALFRISRVVIGSRRHGRRNDAEVGRPLGGVIGDDRESPLLVFDRRKGSIRLAGRNEPGGLGWRGLSFPLFGEPGIGGRGVGAARLYLTNEDAKDLQAACPELVLEEVPKTDARSIRNSFAGGTLLMCGGISLIVSTLEARAHSTPLSAALACVIGLGLFLLTGITLRAAVHGKKPEPDTELGISGVVFPYALLGIPGTLLALGFASESGFSTVGVADIACSALAALAALVWAVVCRRRGRRDVVCRRSEQERMLWQE
jgi:hypothetical protein